MHELKKKGKSPESPAASVDSWVDALFRIYMRISTAFKPETRALRRNWASLGRLSGIKLHRDI